MKRRWFVWILAAGFAGALPLRAGEIHDAASAGDVEKVRALLKAKPDLVNLRELGTTPLHEATGKGHIKVVELLLAGGANVNATNSSNLTPLRLAIGLQRKEVAELLRQRGGLVSAVAPDVVKPSPPPAAPPAGNDLVRLPPAVPPTVPEIKRPDAQTQARPVSPAPALPATTPLATAPLTNAPLARPAITPVTVPIHDSADLGDVEQVRALLREWPELIEAQNEKGLTPLHVAAATAKTNVVEALLARRANVEAKTRYGWTPLHFAATKGHAPTVRLLLTYGAQVDAKTRTDETPLLMAVRAGQVEVVRELLERRADVSARDKAAGSTPLHLAVVHTNQPMVELLLAQGAEVNAQDAHGDTPLVIAFATGRDAIADVLRRHGGQEPPGKPLSALEQSLVDYYRNLDQVFRVGAASEKRKAMLTMTPTKAEVQKIFPRHAAKAWKIIEQLNQEIRGSLDKGFKEAALEPAIWKLQPAAPSVYVQRRQAQGWIAADVPVLTLVVKRKSARSAGDDYCRVNNRWVPLPPLDRVFEE